MINYILNYHYEPLISNLNIIQTDVDVQNSDEPISRKEFNELKMLVSDLKIHVDALLKKSNQQLISPLKRKGDDGSKGKKPLGLKIIRIIVIYLM